MMNPRRLPAPTPLPPHTTLSTAAEKRQRAPDTLATKDTLRLCFVETGRFLGRGNFASVHKIEGLGRKFARKDPVKDPEKTILLSRGAAACPFLLRGYGVIEETMYLEYCKGGSLDAQISGTPMPIRHIRTYAAEMILALEALHAMNVVHLDVKPANVLLTKWGHIRLGDFGTSKICPRAKRAKGPIGTHPYIAPELRRRKDAYFHKASDLWSLGVMLQHMALGAPTEDTSMRSDHPALNALLDALLQKNPENRPTLDALKGHDFFASINWEQVAAEALRPPWVPPKRRG